MSKLKYIRIYEEYTELEEKSLEKHYSWQNVRDVIQNKLPFIIIDFDSEESFKKCIKEELFDEKYVKQIYHYKNQGEELKRYPSVFIIESNDRLSDRVLDFVNRFDIRRLIISDYGETSPKLYVDGETVDLDPNLFSSINIDEMGGDDYYKLDDMFYKFIQ